MFKHFDNLSESLNKGIQLYTERLDMTQRDRELFYDLINFSFLEGKISGKEEVLKDTIEIQNENKQIEIYGNEEKETE
jgi:hypothetical protein